MTYYIAVASASSNSLGTVALNVAPGGQPDTCARGVITSPLSGLTVLHGIFLSVYGTLRFGPNASGVSQVLVSRQWHPPRHRDNQLDGRGRLAAGLNIIQGQRDGCQAAIFPPRPPSKSIIWCRAAQ